MEGEGNNDQEFKGNMDEEMDEEMARTDELEPDVQEVDDDVISKMDDEAEFGMDLD
jgi:hypothetical protein